MPLPPGTPNIKHMGHIRAQTLYSITKLGYVYFRRLWRWITGCFLGVFIKGVPRGPLVGSWDLIGAEC